jgi:hypothetical protein
MENIQLTTDIWETIEEVARLKGATFELSERLRRLMVNIAIQLIQLESPTAYPAEHHSGLFSLPLARIVDM